MSRYGVTKSFGRTLFVKYFEFKIKFRTCKRMEAERLRTTQETLLFGSILGVNTAKSYVKGCKQQILLYNTFQMTAPAGEALSKVLNTDHQTNLTKGGPTSVVRHCINILYIYIYIYIYMCVSYRWSSRVYTSFHVCRNRFCCQVFPSAHPEVVAGEEATCINICSQDLSYHQCF